MIDCGLTHEREYLSRNWEECPVAPHQVEALFLTHAHIDHSGLIPKFVREGYSGSIYATSPTIDLVEIMLRDSAQIQQEDAAYKKRRHEKEGRRVRYPESPLYSEKDVDRTLGRFQRVSYKKTVWLNDVFSVTFHDAGHILGSAILEVLVNEDGNQRRIVFSGDLGQWDRPLTNDPTVLEHADYVVMESTYGDRDHLDSANVEGRLAEVINRTMARRGTVVIPVFAVDRAQLLMYYISRLVHADRIPDMPIFLDSPMAVDVTEVYRRHQDHLDEHSKELFRSKTFPLHLPGLIMVRSLDESKAINRVELPCIIMATVGMCNAGRIKHHLRHNLGDMDNTILFVGYQGPGTLGRQIVDGNKYVRIHGKMWPVRAEIVQIDGLSAHAGRADLLRWLGGFFEPPDQVFLTHGEESVSLQLAEFVRRNMGYKSSVPVYGETVSLY